jgi:hypothetical protein
LTGTHAAIACSDCHRQQTAPAKVVAYRFADLSCKGCHNDPHAGSSRAPACQTCHNVQTWADVVAFDHSTTRFELSGAHRAVKCEQCHKATKAIRFQGTPETCVGCHEDVHAGQFATRAGQDCTACHNSRQWKPSQFDHNTAGFSLSGAHAQVACRDCHTRKESVKGRMVLFYEPTPKDCAVCHGPAITN